MCLSVWLCWKGIKTKKTCAAAPPTHWQSYRGAGDTGVQRCVAELAKQGLAELASQRAISIQVFGELAELAPLAELVEGS